MFIRRKTGGYNQRVADLEERVLQHIERNPRTSTRTILDFFLWGHLKSKVYNDVPTTAENMRQRVLHECRSITAEKLKNMQQEFIYRLQKCIQVHGPHFEHLLK
ncbi:hypothetical protein WN55_02619 [Dufourea novaeangliae]|uniref:Histone-lysine N-methyltransferase SETMAR n=1 Tax=Dufourea novaeangliae TaxID=178035 RepID=A0A154PGT6_DUFNO|nr:hypothetical protein WN55_02619 [Dufourea novaeangliae]